MSLRDFFSKNATESYDAQVDARGAAILAALKSDLEIIKHNMGAQGVKSIFARKTAGRYDAASGHLTYDLYDAQSEHTSDYNTRNKSAAAIVKAIESALGKSNFIKDLHDYCADSAIDMCIKESISNHFEPNGFGTEYQQINATIVIDTQSPYRSTSPRRARPQPAPTPVVPAPIAAKTLTATEKLRAHIEQLSEAEAAELLNALTTRVTPAEPVEKPALDRTIRAPRIPIQKRTAAPARKK